MTENEQLNCIQPENEMLHPAIKVESPHIQSGMTPHPRWIRWEAAYQTTFFLITRRLMSLTNETFFLQTLLKDHPRNIIPELCRVFYHHGWVTGTGGSISIKQRDEIYVTPSGVQKERLEGDDLYVINLAGDELSGPPSSKKWRKSQCTPLFLAAYRMRDAGAVIHSHSMHANLVTMLYAGKEFRISHQEMIKGIKKDTSGGYYRNNEELVVPIIETTMKENYLLEGLISAMTSYPDTCAVLVRQHGIYVWGDTWEQAKSM
ncbi:Methylthioribulose-1-phosphate dehydratase [Apostichopus japonicus]|uniref:Methylthioribulose-1-phosphate dehydratase n=2 Tax=Stichopus japonicus TaxID=307972 RepID=A0A2G8JCC3_STIJA|nr:Methylthioribulose-1-phosphate dehydratase [Apostichopus japonicus]